MPTSSYTVALVEPFFAGSHKRWAEELQARSRHRIDLFTLPGRHWKWRMHGAAVTLAGKLLSQKTQYDLVLATDMLDLATFLALTRTRYAQTPTAVYFHENQLCYPWSPRDKDTKSKKDLHYAFINYTSCLAADKVYFNSRYHKETYLAALPQFLERYPDHQNRQSALCIANKSENLPLGLELRAFDRFKTERPGDRNVPLLLWNHRWEYDKNPKGFCKLLYLLADRNVDFEVAILGNRFDEEPEYFVEAKQKLGQRIVTYGTANSFEAYAQWLWRSDILPVTSRQDFFGGSVVEAIYCGCHPILPDRLAYPEHVDKVANERYFYGESTAEAADRVCELIQSGDWKSPCGFARQMSRYDWRECINAYDSAFDEAVEGKVKSLST